MTREEIMLWLDHLANREAVPECREALETASWIIYGGINQAFELAYKALEERPQGKWIYGGKDVTGQYFYDGFICNKCYVVVDNKSNFCPRCGADMRKGSAE